MRVSNNATAHDVVKIFSQLHYPEERLAVVETTYTEFTDRNIELLVHLVAVTRRSTQTLIKDAVLLQYPSTLDGTASAFSNMVAKSIGHVRVLSRSTTSGKKTHESVKRVAAVMNKQIGKMARSLVRRCSNASSEAACVARPAVLEINSDAESPRNATSASLCADREAVLRLYGGPCAATSLALVSPAHSHTLQYEAEDSVVRVLDSGEELKATMCRGSKGFLLARFPSEEPFETEIPNLMLEEKEPKAATKEVVDAKPKAAAQEVVKPKATAKKVVDAKPKAAAKELVDEAPRCRFHRAPEIRQNDLQTIASGNWGNREQVFQFIEASWSEEWTA